MQRASILYWIVLLLSILVFFANIGDVSIYILDEAKNAECAREMNELDEWIVPTYNYELRTDKPPLHYYFMITAYRVFGVSPFSARFFSACFGIATVLMTFFYTKQHAPTNVALIAALALLSSIHFVTQFHLAVPDPYLIFFMTLAVFAFYSAIEQNNVWQLYIGYTAVALATLAKGIVAMGLIGLIFLSYLLLTRQFNWQQLKQLHLIRGGLLFVAIALPWYVLVGYATQGEWLRGFFFEHNLSRFAQEMEGHGGFFLLPVLFVVLGMLPFSIFLPQAMAYTFKHRSNRFLQLSMIAVAVIITFFCFSATKLPNYTVPAYPFLAICLAHFLSQKQQEKKPKYLMINLLVWLILTIGLIFAANAARQQFLDTPSWLVVATLSPLVIGAVVAIVLYAFTPFSKVLLTLAGSGILSSLFIWYGLFPSIDKGNSVLNGVALLKNQTHVAQYIRMNRAFVFNLQREIPQLNTPEEVAHFFQTYPEGRLITITKYLPELQMPLDTLLLQKDLFENTTTVIVKLSESNSGVENGIE